MEFSKWWLVDLAGIIEISLTACHILFDSFALHVRSETTRKCHELSRDVINRHRFG